MEIEKSAKQAGNRELGNIIQNLSENGIRKLLTLGSGFHNIALWHDYEENNLLEQSFSLPYDIEVLKELENYGLIRSENMSLDEFISYFKNLKPFEKVWYIDSNGSYNVSPNLDQTTKFIELSLTVSQLNEQEKRTISQYGIELSENGKKAFDIIVHAVSEQIRNK